ncbi:hypothetical protein DWB61_14640 [Ancylomarina euxinus]|uniref:Nucleoside phosphorylase domain-containing protein n=1 Tax=Ancylomarina euxinus TaxID=2283627 RepID=A0A425XY03_9BACT|nr:hypothetical protein [Ancylomarina euxinus]MCZ4695880.1 hypothetical protein [Ancylomarina euxinus]MUP16255.1 hypothetical protein [Ancylomarina euxinus]RRG19627.1 hypothetical protein DWB61_14640 [Ancylomarina euxinus]
MDILIVSPTFISLQKFISQLQLIDNYGKNYARFQLAENEFDILISGYGGSLVSHWVNKAIQRKSYDLVVHLGRSFTLNEKSEVGSLVNVIDDYFGDLGFTYDSGFQSLFDLELIPQNESPFNNGILENPSDYSEILTSFRKVSGMTCNTIPANLFQIGEIYIKNYPEIISLDGAAVLYACLESNTDVIQLSYVAGNLDNATDHLNIDDLEIDRITEVLEDLLNKLFQSQLVKG